MRHSRAVVLVWIAAVTWSLVLATGCGRENTIARGSPKATAEAFVNAIREGNFEGVAAGWDYETVARQKQPDWDEIPPGQRNLILAKEQDGREQEVRALAGMMSGEVQVGSPEIEGDRATVPITVGTQALAMDLVRVEGLWKVLEVAEE